MKLNFRNLEYLLMIALCMGMALPVSATTNHVLVLSSDFLSAGGAREALPVFKSTPKISDRSENGFLNGAFRILPNNEDSPWPLDRIGVYTSLWTGFWPEQHGITSIDSDPERLDQFPLVFATLSQSALQTGSRFIFSDSLLKPFVEKYVPDSQYVGSNQEVLASATELIAGEPPSLLWVQFAHNTEGDIRDTYIVADFCKQLLSEMVERSSFIDENWLVIVLGLPVVTDGGVARTLDSEGFAIVDRIGLLNQAPVLQGLTDVTPVITNFLLNPAEIIPPPTVAQVSTNDVPVSGQLTVQNLPQKAQEIEALSQQLEKMTVYLRHLPATIREEVDKRESEQRAVQDKMTELMFNNFSNRLNNVSKISRNYQAESGSIMDKSITLALIVVVVLMIICMATFIITTVIQTRNSRQLAHIMQSFAAYKSQQIQKEISELRTTRRTRKSSAPHQ